MAKKQTPLHAKEEAIVEKIEEIIENGKNEDEE